MKPTFEQLVAALQYGYRFPKTVLPPWGLPEMIRFALDAGAKQGVRDLDDTARA